MPGSYFASSRNQGRPNGAFNLAAWTYIHQSSDFDALENKVRGRSGEISSNSQNTCSLYLMLSPMTALHLILSDSSSRLLCFDCFNLNHKVQLLMVPPKWRFLRWRNDTRFEPGPFKARLTLKSESLCKAYVRHCRGRILRDRNILGLSLKDPYKGLCNMCCLIWLTLSILF